MSRQLFVNLPIADLKRTVVFFTELGFTFNPKFTDETTTCMIVGEGAFVMLMEQPRYREFSPKEITDTATHSEAIFSISAESREDVDRLAEIALANGGKPFRDPQDMGFMYYRTFQDLDGHQWEVIWMDPAAAEA